MGASNCFSQGYNPKFHSELAKVFTWDDSLVDDNRFIKIYYRYFIVGICPTLLRKFETKKIMRSDK